MTYKHGKIRLLCALLCLLIMLCSCAEQMNSDGDNVTSLQSAESKLSLPENIILNIDTSNISAPAVSKLQVEPFKIDIGQAKDLFMANKTIVNENTQVIEADDGSSMSYVGSFFAYSTPFTEYIGNIFSSSKQTGRLYRNSQKYLTGSDISFCSIEDAKEKMKETLHTLGIDNMGDVTVYSLDHENLSNDEQAFRNNPDYKNEMEAGRYNLKGTWTEDDDCYVLISELVMHDIAVMPDDVDSKYYGNILPGNKIECMINKDGIQQLKINFAFTEKSADDSETVMPCSGALQKVIDKYSAIITTNTYTINSVRLMYIPQFTNKEQTEYMLIPAWCFTVVVELSETSKSAGDKYEDFVMINAFTGEEIY